MTFWHKIFQAHIGPSLLPLEFPTHFPQYYSSLKGARFLGEMTASRIRAEKIHKDTGASSRARSGKIKKEKGQEPA